jgi:ribosomal protein L11 methylase PrmA
VLDIGCGTGLYSIEFAKRGATEVVKMDISPSVLNKPKHGFAVPMDPWF